MATESVQSADVIIAGLGPAGLSTALHLLQKDAGWGGRMHAFWTLARFWPNPPPLN